MNEVFVANARLVDPVARTETPGSLLIRGGKIAEVIPGPVPRALAAHPGLLDASGLVACPGFIDVHSHTDGDLNAGEKLLAQGVTTAISGNCGLSPLDIRAFLDAQDAQGYPVHQAELIGHSFCLRTAAKIHDPYRAATGAEIDAMKNYIHAALDAGAAGLSFGIQYAPGTSTHEFRELARVAASRGRIVPVHTRLDFPNDFDSLKETLDIALDTGARVLVSHLAYMYADGQMDKALELIADYRRRGADVWADSGMYTDFATFAGSACFDERHVESYGWTAANFLAGTGPYAGKRLDRDTFADMRKNWPDDIIICFTGVEEDIYRALRFPDVMLSTDSGSNPPGQGHPQGAASFPRFFRIMVREKRQLSLVEAVRRCTIVPALAMNLPAKGRLSAGSDADIVLFNPDTVADNAQFPGVGNPDAESDGIEHVLVAGSWARKNGKRVPGVLAGKAIRFH